MVSEDVGHPAIRYGVIFGLLLGLLGIGVTLIEWQSGAYTPHVSIVGGSLSLSYTGKDVPLGWDCTNALVTITALLGAGALASRRSQRIRSGAGAGLIAGSLGAIMAGVATLTVILNYSPPYAPSTVPGQVNASLLVTISALFTALGACILGGGFGAILGFLGGGLGVAAHRGPAQQMGQMGQMGQMALPPYTPPLGAPSAPYTYDSPTRPTDYPGPR